ncbi:tRNA pseudouridine(55) synthase TruB [Uliginosibacterium sp. H3]|uniref:tRNA pseudouridine synthase B n=1 Tax=Uliginosibacterium silvisoli TaxID=3114758 RepID=A0ABU6K611_9RHOO|nr:tRNA pseudouridine(55) synthase TruB [Uliginosibacterium sp. H3]
MLATKRPTESMEKVMNPAAPRKKWQIVDGVLMLDKPGGMTSNGALQAARRLHSAAKAGHTGTLDPMATGLLPVLFGEATKFSHMLLDADKTYRATLCLGINTSTADAEGEVIRERDVTCSEADIHAACARFLGAIEQVPPMYSALKHQGRALYDYARQGVEIEREARAVTIHELAIERVDLGDVPEVVIRVRCSKGTYIRTLAEDIGEVLGCGAHLTALRRLATGPLSLESAVTLEALGEMEEGARVARLLAPDSLLAHLPRLTLDGALEARFSHGNAVSCAGMAAVPRGEVRVYGTVFMGLGRVDDDGMLRAIRLVSTLHPGEAADI